MPHPLHPLDLIALIIFDVGYKSGHFSLSKFLHPPVTSFLLGPDIVLNTLLLYTLSLYFALN
jgi:hypothetical protein